MKIAIVEDHDIFLQGLTNVLQESFNLTNNEISMHKSAETFIEELVDTPIDLLITDISLPGMDGIELTGLVKKNYPKIKVLILSATNRPSFILNAVKANVDGYLLKETTKDEIIKGINSILKGKKYFDQAVFSVVMENMIETKDGEFKPEIELTDLELEMIQLIAHEYTQDEISIKLNLNLSTLNFYRRNLISKFEVKNSAGLVRKAAELGLLE